MFTITKDLILPSTTTGSFPRPRWFDVSMWGKPLDTCMMDVRFREKFQDALAVVINDQERAGLDILTSGDFHCDEDFAGRSWHHYPLQRWTGLEGDHLQTEETRSAWLKYPPGTLLNEIYTGWRWPRVVDKIEHRPLDYPKLWRMAQAKTVRPVKFGTCCSQVMALFLDICTTKYKDQREVIWDMAVAMNQELLALRDAGCRCIQIEEPCFHFMANSFGKDHDSTRFMLEAYNREVQGLDDVELWIHTCWGNPNMQRVREDTSYAASMEIYLNEAKGDVWTVEMKDRNFAEIELFERFKDSEQEDRRGGRKPPHAPGRPAGGGGRRDPPRAAVHPAGAADRHQRLRLRPAGLQPGNRLLQGLGVGPGLQYRSRRIGLAGKVHRRRRPGLTDRHRAEVRRALSVKVTK